MAGEGGERKARKSRTADGADKAVRKSKADRKGGEGSSRRKAKKTKKTTKEPEDDISETHERKSRTAPNSISAEHDRHDEERKPQVERMQSMKKTPTPPNSNSELDDSLTPTILGLLEDLLGEQGLSEDALDTLASPISSTNSSYNGSSTKTSANLSYLAEALAPPHQEAPPPQLTAELAADQIRRRQQDVSESLAQLMRGLDAFKARGVPEQTVLQVRGQTFVVSKASKSAADTPTTPDKRAPSQTANDTDLVPKPQQEAGQAFAAPENDRDNGSGQKSILDIQGLVQRIVAHVRTIMTVISDGSQLQNTGPRRSIEHAAQAVFDDLTTNETLLPNILARMESLTIASTLQVRVQALLQTNSSDDIRDLRQQAGKLLVSLKAAAELDKA